MTGFGGTVRAQLQLAGAVGRVTGAISGEKLRPRAPRRNPSYVPARVEELTTEWLTAALCADAPGAQVTNVILGAGSDGTSSRRAMTVTYDDAGQAAGLPTALFAKSTPSMLNRLLVGVTGAAGAEALFYRDIRPLLDIGAPIGYVSAWDPRSCRSMVITEDISVTRGAAFADATSSHVTLDEAEGMVREMAQYHAALWDDPRLSTTWNLASTQAWQADFNAKTLFDRGAVLGTRLAGDEVPPELMARKREIRAALMESLARNVAGPHTLVHQDVHPGNWFRLPGGGIHLYDWQGIARGGSFIDVSYALSAGLTTENRRAWEQELLGLYLDELAVNGVKAPTFDEAWKAYREQMMHGFIFWTYTFLVGKVAALQTDAHVRALIRRTGQAVVDLETFDVLG